MSGNRKRPEKDSMESRDKKMRPDNTNYENTSFTAQESLAEENPKNNAGLIYQLAKLGNVSELKNLLKNNCIDERFPGELYLTPAAKLALEGNQKAADILIDLGANVDLVAYGAARGGKIAFAEDLRKRYFAGINMIALGAALGNQTEYLKSLIGQINTLNNLRHKIFLDAAFNLSVNQMDNLKTVFSEPLRSRRNPIIRHLNLNDNKYQMALAMIEGLGIRKLPDEMLNENGIDEKFINSTLKNFESDCYFYSGINGHFNYFKTLFNAPELNKNAYIMSLLGTAMGGWFDQLAMIPVDENEFLRLHAPDLLKNRNIILAVGAIMGGHFEYANKLLQMHNRTDFLNVLEIFNDLRNIKYLFEHANLVYLEMLYAKASDERVPVSRVNLQAKSNQLDNFMKAIATGVYTQLVELGFDLQKEFPKSAPEIQVSKHITVMPDNFVKSMQSMKIKDKSTEITVSDIIWFRMLRAFTYLHTDTFANGLAEKMDGEFFNRFFANHSEKEKRIDKWESRTLKYREAMEDYGFSFDEAHQWFSNKDLRRFIFVWGGLVKSLMQDKEIDVEESNQTITKNRPALPIEIVMKIVESVDGSSKNVKPKGFIEKRERIIFQSVFRNYLNPNNPHSSAFINEAKFFKDNTKNNLSYHELNILLKNTISQLESHRKTDVDEENKQIQYLKTGSILFRSDTRYPFSFYQLLNFIQKIVEYNVHHDISKQANVANSAGRIEEIEDNNNSAKKT